MAQVLVAVLSRCFLSVVPVSLSRSGFYFAKLRPFSEFKSSSLRVERHEVLNHVRLQSVHYNRRLKFIQYRIGV